jgi:hypothetical protein
LRILLGGEFLGIGEGFDVIQWGVWIGPVGGNAELSKTPGSRFLADAFEEAKGLSEMFGIAYFSK